MMLLLERTADDGSHSPPSGAIRRASDQSSEPDKKSSHARYDIRDDTRP
jgi:hypothetical protein